MAAVVGCDLGGCFDEIVGFDCSFEGELFGCLGLEVVVLFLFAGGLVLDGGGRGGDV